MDVETCPNIGIDVVQLEIKTHVHLRSEALCFGSSSPIDVLEEMAIQNKAQMKIKIFQCDKLIKVDLHVYRKNISSTVQSWCWYRFKINSGNN